MTSDSLYFGSATPTGTVTEDDWARFIDDVVAPGFPEGFTVLSSKGQWKSEDGRIEREDGHVMIVIHPVKFSADQQIGKVIDRYKKLFSQQSVMRVTSEVCVSF